MRRIKKMLEDARKIKGNLKWILEKKGTHRVNRKL